jgi:hypothetical protein
VLGGSAASSFGDIKEKSWPYILKAKLPDSIEFRVETRPGLTFVRALNELLDFPNEDLLILHFGTSIGWPVSIVRTGHRLGIDFTSEFGLHQPAFRSSKLANRLRKAARTRFRNSIKYVLYFLGLYKSRVSRQEIEDQINAVINLASKQSKRIMWVQHQALQNRRIYLERRSYKKYYKEILRALEKHESHQFKLVTLPDSFLVQENYLLDCIHVSERGHQEIARILQKAFKEF